ncbi:uncharacterized protein GLRG_11753, partial [Colletotrichum graminicola M1.001]
ILDDTARCTFESAESLATASGFSLYFQHNVLNNESVEKYRKAISISQTEDLGQLYADMRNVKRLYGGGGKVHEPRGRRHGSPPTRDRRSSPASATTASCGSTLPFETVPRDEQESPPPYDCLSEGQSPGVSSDAAAAGILAKSPRAGLAPPDYCDTERWHDVLGPFQRGCCGSEDTDMHLIASAKRKRPLTAFRQEKVWRSLLGDKSHVGNLELQSRDIELQRQDIELQRQQIEVQHQEIKLQRQQIELQRQQIELQRQEIGQLQNNVEELRRQVKSLEERDEALEEDCSNLKERGDQTDIDIDDLSTDILNLGDKCEEAVEKIADVREEFEGLKGAMEGKCGSFMDRVTEDMEERVVAHMNEMKERLRQALQ